MTRRGLPADRIAGIAWDRGLSTVEARLRQRRYGPNDIVETAGRPWLDLARDTARDPMLWFLAVVAAVYAAAGEAREALTLLVAIVPLAAMDVFLHRRTQASTEGLRSRLADEAVVMRDGDDRRVPVREVVPGDLVILRAGQPFAADGVVVDGEDLQADESTLTGEAYPVAKRPLAVLPGGEEPPVAIEHWTFAGTRLLTGQATVRVVFTGGETMYGEIVRSATGGRRPRTPLQRAIQHLVAVLIGVAGLACLVLAAVRLLQGHGWLDALVSAVTLASAALPEEFPVVFAFFLGVGVYRLARRQALVRRAVSVENIGRVSAICSDKTGTITDGVLHLTHLVVADGLDEEDLLRLAARAAREDSGDPLDAAIAREVRERKLAPDVGAPVAVFPFTERRKRETVLMRERDGRLVAVTKGATETVLAMSADDAPARWAPRIAALADEGHKVIACAWRPVDADLAEPEAGYRVAGLLAFEDPVREGVTDALAFCRRAGVHTIMVTGDHPRTALAVAREVGLGGGTPVVLPADEMVARVARGEAASLTGVDVIARAAPGQKLTLVRALQDAGEVVAVTGDGVNDVPALQAADVGIAMGERGTRSAREAASIVLLDDNFRTIVRAIAEGRQLFWNLRLAFRYLLVIHIPLVVTALLVPLAGWPLLYLPVHIVWLETIIHPTALLVFQEVAGDDVARRAAPRRARFFTLREWMGIVLTGGAVTVLVLGLYAWSVRGGQVEHARATALAALTLSSVAITVGLSGLRTRVSRVIAGGTAVLSAVLIQTPALARALHMTPLHAEDWAIVVAAVLLIGLLGGRVRG
jgi:Ca2+-transporting ATPase